MHKNHAEGDVGALAYEVCTVFCHRLQDIYCILEIERIRMRRIYDA